MTRPSLAHVGQDLARDGAGAERLGAFARDSAQRIGKFGIVHHIYEPNWHFSTRKTCSTFARTRPLRRCGRAEVAE